MFFNFKKNYFLYATSLALLSSLFLSACNYSHKLTSYMEHQIVSNHTSEQLINEVGILFVIDASGSMAEETKYLSQNISRLSSLFKPNSTSNYNFGIAVLRDYDTNDVSSQILHTFPGDFHKRICEFKPETIKGFIRESKIGSFFRFSSEDIEKYDSANLFCILSQSIGLGLPTLSTNNSSRYKGPPIQNQFKGRSANAMIQSEHYFLPIQKALERLIPYKDDDIAFQYFFSKNSYLTVIFISDASGDGYSYLLKQREIDEPSIDSSVSIKYADDFYTEITSYKLSSKFSRFYGVIPVSIEKDCGGESAYEANSYPPYHVLNLIKKTKGKAFPVCDTQWGTHMDVISEDLDAFLQKNEFSLKRVPNLDTLEVFYDGIKIESDTETGWYYNPENVSITVNANVFRDHSRKKRKKESKITLMIQYYPINSEVFFQEE